MKIVAVNGSPRKKWNTGMLLEKALEGAASRGAEVELVHLYDLDYKGCVSCFACKTEGGPSYGRCGRKDGLTPLLRNIEEAHALILGSPIYYGTVTGEMRSLLERLFFQYMTYTDPPTSLFGRTMSTGFIYTMNANEKSSKERGFDQHMNQNVMQLKMIFGASEMLCSYDTYQFDDYSKMHAPRFDPAAKARRRAEVFPVDCGKAFEMGVRFAV